MTNFRKKRVLFCPPQILTKLDLHGINIRAVGSRYLASVLQVNRVRLQLSLSRHLIANPLSSYHTDTHNAESYPKPDLC